MIDWNKEFDKVDKSSTRAEMRKQVRIIAKRYRMPIKYVWGLFMEYLRVKGK